MHYRPAVCNLKSDRVTFFETDQVWGKSHIVGHHNFNGAANLINVARNSPGRLLFLDRSVVLPMWGTRPVREGIR
jgi:hypothetical protein